MVYCYCRVSTDKQSVGGQKLAIKEWLKRNKAKKAVWVAESVSGRKEVGKRALGGLLEKMSEGDTLVVTELSRLGRSLIMIFDILQEMLEKGVVVVAIKENFKLADDVQSKVLAFAFGLSAEIERNLISERTKMGLEKARAMGKHIGRRKGEPCLKFKLTGKGAYIRRELAKNRSKLSLAKELGVAWITLDRFVKRKMLEPKVKIMEK